MDQLEALRGVDSLQVVFHRFSDGVEVVKCVLEFCKEVGDVEQNYSNSIQKLLRSSSYSFHSNILMKWLGSDPYQEIGTVRHSWQKLGTELSKLADLHSQKATAYLDAVRKPLQELLPQLEETRQELKVKIQTLKATLETASQHHSKEKQKYFQLGDNCQKLREKSDAKAKQKLIIMESELKLQESIYRDAHGKLLDAHNQFDEDVKNLYQKVQEKEIERVNTLKTSLQQFTKTMSNTAPAYLEGFQRIVISVDEISGPEDIKHFVSDHKELTVNPDAPEFERHPYMTGEAVTQFTDTSTSSVGSSASSAAKKLLSRLNFRESSKSSPPREDSETSVEADPHTNTPSPVNANEESSPTITNKMSSGEAKSLDATVKGPSNSENGAAAKLAQNSNSKTVTGTENSKSARERVLQDSDKSGTMSKSTKQLSQRSEQSGSSGVPPKETARAKKPAVKVRPQQIVAAASPQEPSSRTSGEKAKRELGSSETSSNTNASTSSSSTSASHVSSVVQRMQNSQASQQHHHQQPHQSGGTNVTSRRAPKPAVAAARPGPSGPVGPGPTYPHDSIPGPVKPRPMRKTAPSSSSHHSPRVPRPLSVPNMDDNPSLSLLTSSLPGLRIPECSKEELELLSELCQKAAGSDYYALLGVNSDATMEELARARREKTRVLHPDHFANDPERQAKAQEQLALINQVFQDVLKSEETRRHYDQLCRFRQFYVKIVQQKLSPLETALGKLVNLHKTMKKAQMPLALLDELLLVQKLIRTRIKLLSATS